MKKAREVEPKLFLTVNGSGTPVWVFRWWETKPDGERVRRKRLVGTLEQYPAEKDAEKATVTWRIAAMANEPGPHSIQTMSELIAHFRATEMIDLGEDGRAWSTRDRYLNNLDCWIEPRWGKVNLADIKAPHVESWLRELKKKPRKRKGVQPVVKAGDLKPLAPGSKAKLRNLMSVLYNHAIRWGIVERNPIQGPVPKGRGGVRQSSKRQTVPDILEVWEMRAIIASLHPRERVLVFLDAVTGVRRGELTGLKWQDIDFDRMLVWVERSVVDQVVGPCKTEASKKPIPLDEFTANDLLEWYRLTPYREPGDWVFASNSSRAGKKRGKQPLWLSTIMRYHIQPVVKALGITKRIGWHTFRRTYTSLLTANNENVKVVQELLRHASVLVTLDTYAQAKMQDKRKAQLRVVEEIRPASAEGKKKTA